MPMVANFIFTLNNDGVKLFLLSYTYNICIVLIIILILILIVILLIISMITTRHYGIKL